MKEINIILGNAPIHNGNRGCVALSITSLYLLDDILKKQNINYKLYLCDSGFTDNCKHTYHILNKEIEYYTCGYPIGLSIKETLKYLLKGELKNNIRIFKNADYIFDIGQGDSFADIYGEKRFKMIDRIHKMAQAYSKPYCLLPQTIGPFQTASIREIAHKSIEKSAWIMARDKQSLEYVQTNIPSQHKIDEYIDIAFFMPYQKKTFDTNYIHIGLNVSSLLWNGGYTKNNQFGLTADYKSLIHQIIQFFLSQNNVKLHLIPHVVLGERNIENDYEISFELYEKYNHPNLILSEFFLGPIEAKNYIAGMDFFMGARMHSTIAAFSTGVPVVPMAYSRKFNGLFIDTLNYNYIMDLKQDNNETCMEKLCNAYNQKEHLKAEIKHQQTTTIKTNKERIQSAICTFLNLKQK